MDLGLWNGWSQRCGGENHSTPGQEQKLQKWSSGLGKDDRAGEAQDRNLGMSTCKEQVK